VSFQLQVTRTDQPLAVPTQGSVHTVLSSWAVHFFLPVQALTAEEHAVGLQFVP